eukprot:COSAG05_NODE_5885_length_1066_cov_1.172699_1_plen_261_part_10
MVEVHAYSDPENACPDRPDGEGCAGNWHILGQAPGGEGDESRTGEDVTKNPHLVVTSTSRCSDGSKARRLSNKCTLLPGYRASKVTQNAIACTPVSNQHPTRPGLTCTTNTDSRVAECAPGYMLCKTAAEPSFRVSGLNLSHLKADPSPWHGHYLQTKRRCNKEHVYESKGNKALMWFDGVDRWAIANQDIADDGSLVECADTASVMSPPCTAKDGPAGCGGVWQQTDDDDGEWVPSPTLKVASGDTCTDGSRAHPTADTC